MADLLEENNQDKEDEVLFPGEDFKEMVEAGVFYGLRKTRTHPRMKSYILVNRGGLEIINLHKTLDTLENTLKFVKGKSTPDALVLVVASQPPARESGLKLAREFDFPFVENRWIGGTLTNFKVIRDRVKYYQKLKSDFSSGAFEKYTKKEKIGIEREIERLKTLIGGLENLTRLPDFIIIIDAKVHSTAIREAKRVKIPTVVFTNIDCNPGELDLFVVGNNKARSSISWFFGKMTEAIKEGRKSTPKIDDSSDAGKSEDKKQSEDNKKEEL